MLAHVTLVPEMPGRVVKLGKLMEGFSSDRLNPKFVCCATTCERIVRAPMLTTDDSTTKKWKESVPAHHARREMVLEKCEHVDWDINSRARCICNRPN